MGFPFLAAAEIGTGLLGSILGGGTQVPKEINQTIDLLRQRAQSGIGQNALDALIESIRRGTANQFSALASNQSARLASQGFGGSPIENAAFNRLNASRLSSVGEALDKAIFANEQVKSSALGPLAALAGQIPIKENTGFSQLFGAGLSSLLFNQQNKSSVNNELLLKLIEEANKFGSGGNTNAVSMGNLTGFGR